MARTLLATLPAAALALRATRTTVSMHTNIFPTFTIKDKAAAQPLLDKCVEDTKAESGCLYYGWTVKEDGSKLFCRETYVDGAAAGNHLSCVAASGALGEALEKGYIELDNIDVMGTEADIAAAQKVPEYAAPPRQVRRGHEGRKWLPLLLSGRSGTRSRTSSRRRPKRHLLKVFIPSSRPSL